MYVFAYAFANCILINAINPALIQSFIYIHTYIKFVKEFIPIKIFINIYMYVCM